MYYKNKNNYFLNFNLVSVISESKGGGVGGGVTSPPMISSQGNEKCLYLPDNLELSLCVAVVVAVLARSILGNFMPPLMQPLSEESLGFNDDLVILSSSLLLFFNSLRFLPTDLNVNMLSAPSSVLTGPLCICLE